jgi:dipeptidyl aminopeptidase/acylaminoacyl peptidase
MRGIGLGERRDVPPKHEALAALQEIVNRGSHLFVIHSQGRPRYTNHPMQFSRMCRGMHLGKQLEYAYFEGANHSFTLLRNQERLLGAIEDWACRVW